MFLNVLETKCLENAVILAGILPERVPNSLRTPEKTRTQIVLTVLNARQSSATCDAHFGRRSRSEAQTANGCVRHKFSFGCVRLTPRKLGSAMCFRLAFSPVVCAMDLCRVLVHLLVSTRLDIHYVSRL